MGKKHWQYCNVSHGSHGTMRCTACGKRVTEGEYRVRETEDAFLVQHKSCSLQDPAWARRDAAELQRLRGYRDRLQAYEAFHAQWSEPALEEPIEDLRQILASDHARQVLGQGA